MKRLPKGQKAQVMGTRTFQTMYTAEQMRKFAAHEWVGLTDSERAQVFDSVPSAQEASWWLRFARAIEAKLKEKNHG